MTIDTSEVLAGLAEEYEEEQKIKAASAVREIIALLKRSASFQTEGQKKYTYVYFEKSSMRFRFRLLTSHLTSSRKQRI